MRAGRILTRGRTGTSTCPPLRPGSTPGWPMIGKRWRLRSVASVPSSRCVQGVAGHQPGDEPCRTSRPDLHAPIPTAETRSGEGVGREGGRGFRRRRVRRPNLRQLRPGHCVPRQRALPRRHQLPLPEPRCPLRAHRAQRRGARRLPRAARPAASTALLTRVFTPRNVRGGHRRGGLLNRADQESAQPSDVRDIGCARE